MKIVLEHVSKRYPNRDKKVGGFFTAVDDFDLTIPDGTLVGLLGPSGCGKSTTLNTICGLEAPTEGRVWFGDTDVTDLTPELRGVGMVFQSYALYPHMTVRQIISFPLENLRGAAKLTKDEIAERVVEAARLVQIEELLDRKPAEMSGGQQQRVAIARALVKTPKVLLLDEPLSNLDARLRLTTREEIRRIQRETGVTTIFVTHDQEEAMSICDQIVVMERGIIRQVGRPQDVYDEPASLFVAKFLGTPPISVFDASVRDEKLLIGNAVVLDVPGVRSGPVSAAVRPEGFVVDDEGPLSCGLTIVERMGRDKSVVATHPRLVGATQFRAIIDSDVHVSSHADEVRFSLRRSKTRLFDPETGERLHFAGEEVIREYNRRNDGAAAAATDAVDGEAGR